MAPDGRSMCTWVFDQPKCATSGRASSSERWQTELNLACVSIVGDTSNQYSDMMYRAPTDGGPEALVALDAHCRFWLTTKPNS